MRLQLLGPISRWKRLRIAFGIWLAIALTAGAPWAEAATYYVNASTGSDADDGLSSANAFETITHALSVASNGDTVNVESGLYDTANGEAFPLELRSGVALLGAGAGFVTVVNVTDGGSGYVTAPDVTFSGGGGSGAEAFAVLTGDAVTSVVVTSGGGGYTSAPSVSFSSGAATATAGIGSGVSTISAPEGGPLFLNDEALDPSTRLSGFDLRHDTSNVDDDILRFEVGAFTQAPQIDHNAFVDLESIGGGDTGIHFVDDSTSDGAFVATIANNTMTGLAEGVLLSTGTDVGGAGDDFSPTIQNNSFSSVDYPLSFSFTSSQGGTFAPLIDGNTTWGASDSYYVYVSMGDDFQRFAPLVSNNTFRETATHGAHSQVTFYSGAHEWSPTFSNNTVTLSGGGSSEGFLMDLSINSSSADAQTLTPVLRGNTVTGDFDYGIDLTLSGIRPAADDPEIEFSPTIENNTIVGADEAAIYVTLSQFQEGDLASNMTISGNVLTDSDRGISISVNEFYDTDVAGLDFDWTIANNTITGGGGNGIYVSLSSLMGAPSGQANLLVSANEISEKGRPGIEMYYVPGTASAIDFHTQIEGNVVTLGLEDGIVLGADSAGSGEQSWLIRGNTVSGNDGDGLSLGFSGQENATVEDIRVSDNAFTGNTDFGVRVRMLADVPTAALFSCNLISGNANGVYVGDEGVTTQGGGTVVNFGDGTAASPGHNRIFGNTGFDFYNDGNPEIQAIGNWWGTTDAPTIDSNISDDNAGDADGITGGEVHFDSFLTSADQVDHEITADITASVASDVDGSGGASVGDVVRFCTVITGGAECGSGTAVTVTIPLPPNATLVPNSITTDHGSVHPGEPYITITGVVLDEGETMNVCFDVTVTGGESISATVTADGPDVEPATDTASLAFAAVVVPAVPTTTEWGLILLGALLGLAGLFALRRGGIAALLLACCLGVAGAPRLTAAPKSDTRPTETTLESVTIRSVELHDGKATLRLADGRTLSIPTGRLRVSDRREPVTASATARRAARTGARKQKHAENRIDAARLAAMLSSTGDGQPASMAVMTGRGSGRKIRLVLYATPADAAGAVAAHRSAAAAAAARRRASNK